MCYWTNKDQLKYCHCTPGRAPEICFLCIVLYWCRHSIVCTYPAFLWMIKYTTVSYEPWNKIVNVLTGNIYNLVFHSLHSCQLLSIIYMSYVRRYVRGNNYYLLLNSAHKHITCLIKITWNAMTLLKNQEKIEYPLNVSPRCRLVLT